MYLFGSDKNRKNLSSGFERLFFEQFTAEHHIFGPVPFLDDVSTDSKLAICCFKHREDITLLL
jgi:hypothetical protein